MPCPLRASLLFDHRQHHGGRGPEDSGSPVTHGAQPSFMVPVDTCAARFSCTGPSRPFYQLFLSTSATSGTRWDLPHPSQLVLSPLPPCPSPEPLLGRKEGSAVLPLPLGSPPPLTVAHTPLNIANVGSQDAGDCSQCGAHCIWLREGLAGLQRED